MSLRDPQKALRGARTEYYCAHCRTFSLKPHPYVKCPRCGTLPPQPNEGLRAARMNSALWAQAERAK